MKRKIKDFTSEEKQIIRKLYLEGFSIQDIAELINFTYYEVLYCLRTEFTFLSVDSTIHGAFVDDKQVVVLSDTHLGSKYENLDYFCEAQKFAIDNGIHTIYHTGDVFQSTYTNVQPKYQNEYAQLEHFVRDVPYHPSIRYIVVFGNHDFNTFSENEEFMEIFLSRKDFYLLGVEFGFINWRGATICLFHPVKRNPLKKPHYDKIAMTFRGHSHQLRYRGSSTTYVPALCDDPVNRDTVVPGFLVSTNNDNYLSVDSYYFKDSLHYGGRVQHKKL